MTDAATNEVYRNVLKVHGETSPTLVADILDASGSVVVAGKTLTLGIGGYLFEHVFTDVGLFGVKIYPTAGTPFVEVVRVVKPVEDKVWEYTR